MPLYFLAADLELSWPQALIGVVGTFAAGYLALKSRRADNENALAIAGLPRREKDEDWARNKIDGLQASVTALAERCGSLEATVRAQELRIADLTADFRKSRDSLHAAREQLQFEVARNGELRGELSSVNRILATKEKEIDDLKKEVDLERADGGKKPPKYGPPPQVTAGHAED